MSDELSAGGCVEDQRVERRKKEKDLRAMGAL